MAAYPTGQKSKPYDAPGNIPLIEVAIADIFFLAISENRDIVHQNRGIMESRKNNNKISCFAL